MPRGPACALGLGRQRSPVVTMRRAASPAQADSTLPSATYQRRPHAHLTARLYPPSLPQLWIYQDSRSALPYAKPTRPQLLTYSTFELWIDSSKYRSSIGLHSMDRPIDAATSFKVIYLYINRKFIMSGLHYL